MGRDGTSSLPRCEGLYACLVGCVGLVDFLIQRMTLRGILLRWVLPGFVKNVSWISLYSV
jgi:hypothetical protein